VPDESGESRASWACFVDEMGNEEAANNGNEADDADILRLLAGAAEG
jgi:hypothetical protein